MSDNYWSEIIKPKRSLFDLKLNEIWQYRDLLRMFVWRDFVAEYKQTILGPIWFFIQPLFTTLTFIIIFGKLAKIPTEGGNSILFYLAGITCWNYFSECFMKSSTTFVQNQNIFGKVYFPRLIKPLSIIVSNLIKFGIQFLLFLVIYVVSILKGDAISPTKYILLFPVVILSMAGLGLGFGIIFTALTTKYKDLTFLLQFGIQLMMYATSVIYPLSQVPFKYKTILYLNPISHLIEAMKLGFLGVGTFEPMYFIYSIIFMIVILLFGIVLFTRTEQNFMDTV